MRGLIVPRRKRLSLPSGRVPRIDWKHPLTAGLLNAWVFSGGKPVSLTNGFILSPLSAATVGSSSRGAGWKFNGSSQAYITDRSDILPSSTSSCALATVVTPQSTTANLYIFSHGNTGFGTGQGHIAAIAHGPSNGTQWAATIGYDGGGSSSNLAGGSLVVGTPNVVAANINLISSSTNTLYVNGVSVATNTTPASINLTTNATSIGCLARSTNVVFTFDLVHCCFEWSRTLSSAEHLLLADDPYGFLIFPEDEMRLVLAGIISGVTPKNTSYLPILGVG